MPARQDRGILLPLKFLIGHRAYRAASRPAALALQHTPDGVKYGIGEWMRRSKMPYSVVRPGDVVVQVGAPRDLVRAGRSRSVYFLRRVGPEGRVVVFEPDLESASYLEEFAARNGLGDRLIMVRKGAWSKDDTLTFLSNPNHPASNLVKGARDIDTSHYVETSIPVTSLDAELRRLGIPTPRLVSITANGSETAILSGMEGLIRDGVGYIALARTGADYPGMMKKFGYELAANDDRGFTFSRPQPA